MMLGLGLAESRLSEISGTQVPKIYLTLDEVPRPAQKPLVLVFFSLECAVCWEELFEVKYFIEKERIPVELAGISGEAREELEPFLAKYGFFYPVVSDRWRALYRRFRVKLEPVVVIIEGDRLIYQDSTVEDFSLRREKVKQCLLKIASKSPA
jgi:peroxiredoxin